LRTLLGTAVLFCVSVSAAGQTSPTGSVQVSTAEGTCLEATELRLWELQQGPSGVIGRSGRSGIKSLDCRWTLTGLKAGTYQIDLMVPAGSAGSSQPFPVRDGGVTRVVIAPPVVRVTGRVSLPGKPIAAARLEFNPSDRRFGPTIVATDGNGWYSVALAEAARYDVLLQGRSAPTASKVVDVAVGVNTIDWALTASGSVTVRLKNRRAGLPANIRIESRRASHTGDVAPHEDPLLVKEGLDFEEYSVSAVQGDETLVSEIKVIRLDAEHPSAVVDLDLAENRSLLVLTDENGNPVRNAIVRSHVPAQFLFRGGRFLKQTEPGVFPLDGLRPGMFLMIRADGVVPACRTVPSNSTIYARLEVGRRVDVQLPRDMTPAVVRELSALTDVPGSDCPVPLADFRPQLKPQGEPARPTQFEVEHFPSSTRFGLLRLPLPPRQILIPDRGEVVVERH